jgi:hypothetical protein
MTICKSSHVLERCKQPSNFTSLIAPDTVAGKKNLNPLSKHVFNLNGYPQYVVIILNIFYIKTTIELRPKTCSVCDSKEGFLSQKKCAKVVQISRKKLMKSPYLDNRFQQGF